MQCLWSNFLSHVYFCLRSQENGYKVFRPVGIIFVVAVTKQLGIHIPHQILKRHSVASNQNLSIIYKHKLLFLPKWLKGQRPTGERFTTLLKFTLCVDECEQEWNSKLIFSISLVGVCHCLATKPRKRELSPVAFATVWASGFNSSSQSTIGTESFVFLVC